MQPETKVEDSLLDLESKYKNMSKAQLADAAVLTVSSTIEMRRFMPSPFPFSEQVTQKS
jgi:hypothetical protein